MDDQKVINFLKGLVIDGVNKANSGHPGGAMSSMDFAYVLFTEYLKFNPDDPNWMGRDRFILSAGHESMLQYSILYALDWLKSIDLKSFRQWQSSTPGHPENELTPGVECTTGPLGQGAAMSVGFAIASSHMAATFDENYFDQRTWVILGDGCMQEGVTYGAASLAGHLRLSNLVWYYDKNKAQISGNINKCMSDNEVKVFEGLGWHVEHINGHSLAEIRSAINKSLEINDKPSLIVGETSIAKGAETMEGSHHTHGAPLPSEERLRTKLRLGVPEGEDFYWPDDAALHFKRNFKKLRNKVSKISSNFDSALKQNQSLYHKYLSYFSNISEKNMPSINWDHTKNIATRNAFGKIIESWSSSIPNLIGGSADLEPSNMTGAFAKKVRDYSYENPKGRNINFGVREFPMSSITNGIALYGGIIPFDATFLAFADYSRPALRLGAIQKCRVIHEFTHDSFYLGEDGPTHQPIEQLMSLRLMPGMYVMRPADPIETEVLMKVALHLQSPTSLCLTRQKVPYLPFKSDIIDQARFGAWVVKQGSSPDLIIFASGSEVHLALNVAKKLEADNNMKSVKVVSVPCWELFFEQEEQYIQSIMTPECGQRMSIEAATSLGWERFTGANGLNIGINHFGASAPAGKLEIEFGFSPESICKKVTNHFVN